MRELKTKDLSLDGFYRGKVLDNDDPKKQGRIKVQIYPAFCDISNAEYLPWATPASPLVSGAGNGYGCLNIPEVGTFVFCFFEAGDPYQPVYFAEAQTATYGVPDVIKNTHYPNTRGFRTKSGVEIYIDDEEKVVRVNHPSGTYALIDEDGDFYFNPTTERRTLINALSLTTKSYSSGKTLDGDDGGLVLINGPITLTLPAPSAYPGMIYAFERLDAGRTPAIIAGAIETLSPPTLKLTGAGAGAVLCAGPAVWHILAQTGGSTEKSIENLEINFLINALRTDKNEG